MSIGRAAHAEKGNTNRSNDQAGTNPQYSCEYGSMKYFIYCGFSGMISCGITHPMMVPIDVVKCRVQVNQQKYKNLITGFKITVAEEGMRGLVKGWAPTAIGYSLQGFGKFGFYEVFKNYYSNIVGPENTHAYRIAIYLAASASAEFLADIALAPWEATKIRMQTQDNWANTLRKGLPKFYAEEGLSGFYKGIVPLWFRQIPYTMMKFTCFERTVEALFEHVVQRPREECSKVVQLGVSLVAGYTAGIVCAVVSHPADTIVSQLNEKKDLTLTNAIRKVGFAGMWKGLGSRILMIGTLTALQWCIYDSLKIALAMPPAPPLHDPFPQKNNKDTDKTKA